MKLLGKTPLLLLLLAAVAADTGHQRNHGTIGNTFVNTVRTRGGAPGYGGFSSARPASSAQRDFNGVASEYTLTNGQYALAAADYSGNRLSGQPGGFTRATGGTRGGHRPAGLNTVNGGYNGFGRNGGGYNRANNGYAPLASGFAGQGRDSFRPGAGYNGNVAGFGGSRSTFGSSGATFGSSGAAFGSSGATFGSAGATFGNSRPSFGGSGPSYGGSGVPGVSAGGGSFRRGHIGGHSAYGGYSVPGSGGSAGSGNPYLNLEALLGGQGDGLDAEGGGGRFGRDSSRFAGRPHIGGHTPFGGYSPPGTYGRERDQEAADESDQ